MKILAVAVAAAMLLLPTTTCGGRALEQTTSSEALVLVNAESVEMQCPADAACKLEIGTAFGDPWVKAEAGDVGYFEVCPSGEQPRAIPPHPVCLPDLARKETKLVSMPNYSPVFLDQAIIDSRWELAGRAVEVKSWAFGVPKLLPSTRVRRDLAEYGGAWCTAVGRVCGTGYVKAASLGLVLV